ncbi:hypothetical protein BTA51_03775 [Hahella sp. CCB-MM4]|uniref:hypothetical protein n=1 Tax=Hahella sp. (strain CCB-MM4) TaxID=1926491 RepID=UPI000B9BB114|nr:hypothetical protein [Hahella sp. CCB-MM4]OZG74151.1 hypothetical protein BTA51_03775 [Hahella sp. CCB-MM4]
MKSAALKLFFQAERETCNQMVISVRHQSQLFDTNDLNWFVVNCLDPLMLNLDGQSNQTSFPVAHAGFIHGLELVSLNWIKSDDKRDFVLKAWNEYYPKILNIIQLAPHKVFAETSNLFSHLLGFGHERPLCWLSMMSKVLGELDSYELFKQAGFVCAWMAGLAHFRDTALNQLETMPAPIVRALFDLSDDIDLKSHLARLRNSRWAKKLSATENGTPSSYCVERRIGRCDLLGGEFPLPPQALNYRGQLLIKSGELAWQLHADAFGSTLIPSDIRDLQDAAAVVDVQVLSAFSNIAGLHDVSGFSSVACLTDTVVLTSQETFAVIILSTPEYMDDMARR